MTEYKRFEEKAWKDFGSSLLSDKGSDKQKLFLEVCKKGKDDFIQYMNENLLKNHSNTIDGQTLSINHKFSEREFRFPPLSTQKIIWETFCNIPDEYMTLCGFFGYVIFDMIKNDFINPHYLASNLNGVHDTGLYMIDKSLDSNDDKTVDDCVRRILRSMSNPEPRGKRIIFNDFYLGKSYWRWNWANKMLEKISLSFEEILKIFDETSYSDFSEKMHTGKSYISQVKVLGGLLLFLKETNLKGKLLIQIIDTISYLSAWKAIEIQSPENNKKEIELIFNNL